MAQKPNRGILYQSKVHKPKTNFPLGTNDGTATGIGGEERRKTVDSIVDDALAGEKKKKR